MFNHSGEKEERLVNIKTIANTIKEHRTLEDSSSIRNKAVASFDVSINNNNYILWLVNDEITSGIKINLDFVGNPVINSKEKTTLERKGKHKMISKNSKMAGHLIMSDSVFFSFAVNGHKNDVNLFSQADFDPFIKFYDAINLTIRFKKEDILYRYKSLSEILEQINTKKLQIEELEKIKNNAFENEDGIQSCLEQQKRIQIELETLYNKKQEFIIDRINLRYKAILDSTQEKIKRGHYFDGNILLIEGGPGTGKTTTLIQRIKYLIDPGVIQENEDLFDSRTKRKILNVNDPPWVFFSPNELLHLYLREAMTREGLQANSETGKVWEKYRTLLMWKYDLSNKTTKKPFVLFRDKNNSSLFASDAITLTLLKERFFLNLLTRFNKRIDVQSRIYNTNKNNLISNILRYLKNNETTNIDRLVHNCIGIKKVFAEKIGVFEEEFNNNINKFAAALKNRIQKKPILLSEMQSRFSKTYSLQIETSLNFKEEVDKLLGYNKFENWFFSQCKRIIESASKHAYSGEKNDFDNYVNTIGLSEIFNGFIGFEKLSLFGKIATEYDLIKEFKNPFSNFVLDDLASCFSEIRESYQEFLSQKSLDFEIFSQINIKDKNRLHPQEQSFIIGMINELLERLFKASNSHYASLSHKYKKAYRQVSKIIIAIDEASDFHIFDLYAIISLKDLSTNSVTLCGDLMQRIKSNGLDNWDIIKSINSNFVKVSLNISYRQSPSLLDLASLIYEKSTGNKLNIKPFFERSENEPTPIYSISKNEDEKITWIANRILEIYEFYDGELPSVAIFLSNEEKIDNFALKLGNIEDLSDVGIEVKACKKGEVLGINSAVRVFSLEYIKGLEFEAVLFHNLDDLLQNSNDKEILLRKIYIGLSRATFYIGITLSNDWNQELSFLKSAFSEDGSWQNQTMFYV